MKSRAVVLNRYGGPEELQIAECEVGAPGPGEILVRQTAVGVNFHDCYVRSGLYRTLAVPGIPGLEGVGFVEAVGEDTSGLRVGDRIYWISPAYGGYAAARILPAALALPLPQHLSDEQAAATLMKAFTVCMLLRKAADVGPGDWILVHAAAGGVGQLLCSWASSLGARVIGTVGSAAKAQRAHDAGAEDVILYREEDVASRVDAITGGRGANVVYDAIGADTFDTSLACLGFEGKLINYGQASGPVAPFSPAVLAARSLSVTRPIVFHYLRTRDRLEAMARGVFEALEAGAIRPIEPLRMALDAAADAHRLLESGQSPGGIVLAP